MNTKTHLSRLLQKKRIPALLLIAALLAVGTFSGCTSKTKEKTKTYEAEQEETMEDMTPDETPTETSSDKKEEDDSKPSFHQIRSMIRMKTKNPPNPMQIQLQHQR